MSRHRAGLVLLVLMALVTGCGAAQSVRNGDMELAEEWSRAESGMEAPAAEMAPAEPGDDADIEAADQERMIVYTGDLSLVVEDTDAAQSQVIAIATGASGYVAGSSSYSYDGGLRRVTLTIRVPAASFNEVMDSLRVLALEVTQDSVDSEDVTQDYVDLQSRLAALEVKAERLEDLMDDAEDTEAVLAVYEELSETQIEIEETKGRMRYLERRSSMSTITVSLTPDELSQPVEIAGWRPQGTIRRAFEALVGALRFLVDALIWIVILVAPVVLFIGLVIFVLVRLLRVVFGKRKRRRSTEEDAAAADGAQFKQDTN